MRNTTEEKQPPGVTQEGRSITTRWPWDREPGQSTSINTTIEEEPKAVISKDCFLMFSWHFWAISPCLVTVVIFALNFTEYTIGTWIGKDGSSTDTALGILQVASKAHEIIMVIGLMNIVRQGIQWSLIGGGTLLGLLGAELSLGSAFLISQEFRTAPRYGFSGEPRHRKILSLVVLIFVVCGLCTVVGPASAVLMIPQLDWFSGGEREWVSGTDGLSYRPLCYPYILIDPRLGGGEYTPSVIFNLPIPSYWRYSIYLKQQFDSDEYQGNNTHITHRYIDIGLPVTINSTTTPGRPLGIGKKWKGGTNLTAIARLDTFPISTSLSQYEPLPKNWGSATKYIADMAGIDVSSVCRRRRRMPCENSNSSDWCYMFPSTETDDGPLQSSQDLLLVADHSWGDDFTTVRLPKFWITECLRTDINKKFTDSLVFVFEDAIEETLDPVLTVCSISATLTSVTAMSTSKPFTGQEIQPHDYLNYFRPNGSTTYMRPRTILYHENWLDMIHQAAVVPGGSEKPLPETINSTYTARSLQKPTENIFLKGWAMSILNAYSSEGWSIWENQYTSVQAEAGALEIVVGGSYLSMLCRMTPSNTQYSISSGWYSSADWFAFPMTTKVQYPEELMPESRIDCAYIYKPIKTYHYVYGYRSKSAASILSIMVLVIYCLFAILGSLRQWQKGSIIRAWNSVPEYGTLCLGTSPENGGIGNTCVGIGTKDTLKTVVGVVEADGPGVSKEGDSGESGKKHLELVVFPPVATLTEIRDPNRKYGINGNWRNSENGTPPPVA